MNDRQVMHAMGIDDAYHVERVLASGAGGVTELVTLDGSGPFVRKRIPAKLARRGVWATLAECGCARLPKVEATYEMPDDFVVICDYVPGENLEQLVAAHGRLAEKDARELVAQVAEAAAALHAHGIVHRDISPRNVVCAADGAHLIDLGIARFRVEGAVRDTTQLGTWGFASPEQCGFAQTDARSDVYSLGRLLGYLLTGVLSDADDYERLLADGSVVSPAARAIVERASALEPSARYQSAEELAEALRAEGSAVTAVPPVQPVERAHGGAGSASPNPALVARSEPATLVEGLRVASSKTIALVAADAVLLGVVPLLVFGGSGVWMLFYPPQVGGWGSAIFSLLIAAYFVGPICLESCRALLGVGGYAEAEHPVWRWVVHLVCWFVALFAALFCIAMAETALGG